MGTTDKFSGPRLSVHAYTRVGRTEKLIKVESYSEKVMSIFQASLALHMALSFCWLVAAVVLDPPGVLFAGVRPAQLGFCICWSGATTVPLGVIRRID